MKAEADRLRSELSASQGLASSTFEALARDADHVISALTDLGISEGAEPVERARGVLRSAADLHRDPASGAVPPLNEEVYSAAVMISELVDVIATVQNSATGLIRLLASSLITNGTDARLRRLTLGFGALCRRARIPVRPKTKSASIELTISGWDVAGVGVVPEAPEGVDSWCEPAKNAVTEARRPCIVVLDASPILPLEEGVPRVADDATAITVASSRIDRFLLGGQDRWAEQIGTDAAFALAAYATTPVINAASKRLLFIGCFRCINLCSVDDPRADRLAWFMDAIATAPSPTRKDSRS